jgi:DedD protein
MALPDFFKRKPADDPGSGGGARPVGSVDAVEKVRTRTRQRLIGAVLLLTLGVIGFPLLFESQPRPIPVDIPIEIPKPDGAPALSLPAPRADSANASPPAASESTVASGVVTRDAPPEPMPAAEPAVASAPASAPPAVPAAPAAVATVTAPAAKVAAAAAKPAVAAEPTASTASSTKAASAADGQARFVVQVGAFADPASAREVRLKMEKLGMKTYTQVAETPAGKRIRVRLGPFATRAEADKAQARSKEVGVPAVVLTL